MHKLYKSSIYANRRNQPKSVRREQAVSSTVNPFLPPQKETANVLELNETYVNEVQFYCSSFLCIQFSKHFCGNREMTDKDEYSN